MPFMLQAVMLKALIVKGRSRAVCGVWLISLLASAAWAGELHVGGGFGEQVGNLGPSQHNSVVDVSYDFYDLQWESWQVTLGAGISAFWNDYDDKSVLIFSVLPSLRYYFAESELFKPYVFATGGPSYLTEKKLGRQLLGGYVAFNDFIGVGTYVGRERVWSAGWCWRHISNADLYKPNEGFDVPFCFFIGRRF